MHDVVVIGGGVAGMQAAVSVAEMGYRPLIVEREDKLGGKLNQWYKLAPTLTLSEDVTGRLLSRIGDLGIETRTGVEAVALADGGVRLSSGETVGARAVIIATGVELFDAARKEEYGYGIYDNVITTAELEAHLRAGDLKTAQGITPRRVAFIHCVGSRDAKVCQEHCSRLCCITAVKQAIEVREMLPAAEVYNFYMDIRMFGPMYEEIYRQAQEQYNIHFVRGRVSEAGGTIDHRVQIKAEDTLIGRPLRMTVDLLVLAVGMSAGRSNEGFAQSNSALMRYKSGYMQPYDLYYDNVSSGVPDVFYAGAVTAPKSVGEAMNEGTAAAHKAAQFLKQNS